MKIARTIGTVTLSKSLPAMQAAQLRCVEIVDSIDRIDDQPLGGDTVVAWDLCGTGIGDLVALAEGPEFPSRSQTARCVDRGNAGRSRPGLRNIGNPKRKRGDCDFLAHASGYHFRTNFDIYYEELKCKISIKSNKTCAKLDVASTTVSSLRRTMATSPSGSAKTRSFALQRCTAKGS